MRRGPEPIRRSARPDRGGPGRPDRLRGARRDPGAGRRPALRRRSPFGGAPRAARPRSRSGSRRGPGGRLDRRLGGPRSKPGPGGGGRPRGPPRVARRPRAGHPWTRRWRWPARSSRVGRWTSSSWTFRPTRAIRAHRPAAPTGPGRPGGRPPPALGRGPARPARRPRPAVRLLLVVLEPPGLPALVSSAIAESTGLRLELARRSWIRLGRDIVGQRTEVVVARNRFGPAGETGGAPDPLRGGWRAGRLPPTRGAPHR